MDQVKIFSATTEHDYELTALVNNWLNELKNVVIINDIKITSSTNDGKSVISVLVWYKPA